jgi:hypothetical protein
MQVTVSFTEIGTVNNIRDHWVYTNCYTHFPQLLSDLDDNCFKIYGQNAVQI